MTLEFQTTSPDDVADVASALITGFKAEADASFADPRLLRWKYFEPGPQWESSRGYVLRKNELIKAHCGVWPMNLRFSGQRVTCLSFVDWVSDRDIPGAGVLLKKKLMRLAEAGIVVGGSADTRAVVPRIGFSERGQVDTFVRVVRPWKQHQTRPPEALLKGTARLLRNAAWSLSAQIPIPDGWRAVAVDSFGDWVNESRETSFPTPERSAEYLNYWLRVPAAKMSGFSILHGERTLGYFLLSRVAGQTRIADIRLWSDDVSHWSVAYGLATRAAGDDPDTCEILGIASTPFAREALMASGFRERGTDPLYVYDPKGKLLHADPMFLNLIDGDGAYLYDPEYPYHT